MEVFIGPHMDIELEKNKKFISNTPRNYKRILFRTFFLSCGYFTKVTYFSLQNILLLEGGATLESFNTKLSTLLPAVQINGSTNHYKTSTTSELLQYVD